MQNSVSLKRHLLSIHHRDIIPPCQQARELDLKRDIISVRFAKFNCKSAIKHKQSKYFCKLTPRLAIIVKNNDHRLLEISL